MIISSGDLGGLDEWGDNPEDIPDEILLASPAFPSALQVFASVGGLALLAEHLPLLYPDITRQGTATDVTATDNNNVPDLGQDWVTVESSDELYDVSGLCLLLDFFMVIENVFFLFFFVVVCLFVSSYWVIFVCEMWICKFGYICKLFLILCLRWCGVLAVDEDIHFIRKWCFYYDYVIMFIDHYNYSSFCTDDTDYYDDAHYCSDHHYLPTTCCKFTTNFCYFYFALPWTFFKQKMHVVWDFLILVLRWSMKWRTVAVVTVKSDS